MGYAFNSTTPNLNRAVNELNRRIFGNFAGSLINTLGGLVHGGGSIAPDASMERAVQWGLGRVGKVTYSQDGRQIGNLNATVLDCSAFVLTALLAGGIDMISAGATYTGDMREVLVGSGYFMWIPSSTGYVYAEDLIRGDILLRERNHPYAHTQFYIGENTDMSCGPKYGVSTFEHRVYYEYGTSHGWDGVLRFIGSSGSGAGGGFSGGGGSGTGGGGGGAH